MAIDQERWTLKVQEAMRTAIEHAHAQNNPEVTPDHVLGALLGQADGLAYEAGTTYAIADTEERVGTFR